MEEEELKMLSLERWIFERDILALFEKKSILNRTVILRNNARK